MSYNDEIRSYKEKYEKRRGRVVSDDEATFLHFKNGRITTAVVSGVIGTIIVIAMILFAAFGRTAETPIGYLLASAMALLMYSVGISSLVDIKNYWKQHEKPVAKRTLTRAAIADPENSPHPPKENRRFVTVCSILLVFFALLALVYRDNVSALAPLVLASFVAVTLIIDYFSRRYDSRVTAKVAAGHYLLCCAKLLDKEFASDADSTTIYYLMFGDDLPKGDGFNRKKRAGYYSIRGKWYEKAEVGGTYYFVLIKPKRAEKTGEEIYEIYQMYSADEYEPDSEVRLMVRTGRSAQP